MAQSFWITDEGVLNETRIKELAVVGALTVSGGGALGPGEQQLWLSCTRGAGGAAAVVAWLSPATVTSEGAQ